MHSKALPSRIWWPWDTPVQRVGFLREFIVGEQACARLYVSASGPYRAWLDGDPLPQPETPHPSWRTMHVIEVTLSPGAHRLAIEAEPGAHGGAFTLDPPKESSALWEVDEEKYGGQPFLLACLDWEEGNVARRVGTDAQWRMQAEPPAGWAAQPPDATWRPAWAFDGVWAEPWGMPRNAPLDFCRLSTGWQTVQCQRLLRVLSLYQGLTTAGASAQVLEGGRLAFHPALPYPPGVPRLHANRPGTLCHHHRYASNQILSCWLDLFEARAPHAVLDAGAETFARVQVRLRSGGPAICALTTGESINELHRYARRSVDIFELRDGESFVTAPDGFRYVKVTVLSAAGDTVILDPPELQHIRYPVQRLGTFTCSDDELNAIWELSARTLHLCMQNELWDGIKRDQLPWMGDLYVEALAAYHVFGDYRLARRSLAVLAEVGPAPARPLAGRRYPGLSEAWKTPGGDINAIPSYTMWWVVGLADYLLYSGDISLVEELAEELAATLNHIAARVDGQGLWRFDRGFDYVDWAPLSREQRHMFCHLLACQAMRLGAGLLAAIGRPDAPYRSLHERMAGAAHSRWLVDGSGLPGASHHLPAMAIRSGILDDRECAALFNRTLAADAPMTMSYWHRYADLEAAAIVGQVQWGLAYIKRHWGPFLQMGATSLWEVFEPAWMGADDPHRVAVIAQEYADYGGYGTSLCHGWSVGPAAWLHRALLGVRPAAPGFTRAVFAPHLGDLTAAQGTIPTPAGPIHVTLDGTTAGAPAASITVARNVELLVPPAIRERWRVEVVTDES